MTRTIFLAILLCSPTILIAAQPRVIDISAERGSCGNCAIELVAGPVLGGAADTVSPRRMATAVKRSDGGFVVGPMDMPGTIGLYSREGKLERLLGRTGAGPGEFATVVRVDVDQFDTLFVLDSRRISVLNPSGIFVRSIPLIFSDQQATARRTDGNFAIGPVNGRRTDLGRIIIAPVRTAPTVPAFNTDVAAAPDVHSAYRRVAAASDNGVWVARANKYLIERYDASGRVTLSLTRQAPWFREWSTKPTRPDAAPHPSEILSIWEDSARNHIWVFATLASSNFRAEPNPALGNPGELAKYYDAIFEVIDLQTNTLIHSARIPNRLLFPVNGQPYLSEILSGVSENTLMRIVTPRLTEGR